MQYKHVSHMVNFEDKSMPTAIKKALDSISDMSISASAPYSMDESTVKGVLKYLHDLGVPASPGVVMTWGEQEG